jgi:hypothetical protein
MQVECICAVALCNGKPNSAPATKNANNCFYNVLYDLWSFSAQVAHCLLYEQQ